MPLLQHPAKPDENRSHPSVYCHLLRALVVVGAVILLKLLSVLFLSRKDTKLDQSTWQDNAVKCEKKAIAKTEAQKMLIERVWTVDGRLTRPPVENIVKKSIDTSNHLEMRCNVQKSIITRTEEQSPQARIEQPHLARVVLSLFYHDSSSRCDYRINPIIHPIIIPSNER